MNTKHSANRAILSALMQGRRISQMDAREFQVEDIRTPISHLKRCYQTTHELKHRWIVTPVRKARIKEYWLEERA